MPVICPDKKEYVFVLVEIIYHYRHLHLLHISCLSTLPYPRCITQTCASPCSSILNHILLIQGRSSYKEISLNHILNKILIQGAEDLGGKALVPALYSIITSPVRYPCFLIEWIYHWIENSQFQHFEETFELNFVRKQKIESTFELNFHFSTKFNSKVHSIFCFTTKFNSKLYSKCWNWLYSIQ